MSIVFKKNGNAVHRYEPSYVGQSIVIGIDSSKSNTAICVGDLSGNILDDYEIAGGGSDVDVYDLCKSSRRQLATLFQDANIMAVGIEDIITKKEKGYNGLDIHQSRYKITAVYDSMIFMFDDYFNKRPIRVSNWSWKSTILPSSFRTKEHKKGSKDWFQAMGSPYGNRKDDVTDAICIYMYLIKTLDLKEIIKVTGTKPINISYQYLILPETAVFPNMKEFEIVNDDTLEDNIATIASMLTDDEAGVVKVPTEHIPIEELYSDRLQCIQGYKFGRHDEKVLLFIKRGV